MVAQFGVAVAGLRERDDVVEDIPDVGATRADGADTDDGGVPDLMLGDLGYGDVVTMAHPLDQRLHDPSLVFERVTSGDREGETTHADDHSSLYILSRDERRPDA